MRKLMAKDNFEERMGRLLDSRPREKTSDCLEENTLRALVRHQVKEPDAATLMAHVAFCAYCSDQYEGMVFARRLASQMRKRAALETALAQLMETHAAVRDHVTTWLGRISGAEEPSGAVLQAWVKAGQEGAMQFQQALSAATWKPLADAYMGAQEKEADETFATGSIILANAAGYSAGIVVEQDAVTVTFLDWQKTTPPLVLLVSEEEDTPPLLPDLRSLEEAGAWTAHFAPVKPGSYMIAIAPDEREQE
jgi:hypothetical protein